VPLVVREEITRLYISARKTITRFSLFSGKVLRRNLLKRTSNGGTVILGPG
jgi:hypothetical protein